MTDEISPSYTLMPFVNQIPQRHINILSEKFQAHAKKTPQISPSFVSSK